ncbi:MAG: glutamine synthetase [Theionarchaea archaeon]|nr:glutamine synthetase [Theionarchaea archaeon]MBU7037456.1 glutamine synthetase [Theionarchaea archaeon]
MHTPEDIVDFCEERNIRLIKLQFADLVGELKQFEVPLKIFPKALEEGLSFDGSSVTGMNPVEESDLVVKPDVSTFIELPLARQNGKEKDRPRVARVLCNIYEPQNGSLTRHPGDPRFVLQKNLEYALKKGFIYNVGPELEFFMFEQDGVARVTDSGGYFASPFRDRGERVREQIIGILSELGNQTGIEAEYSHHEAAFSQHEIDLNYAEALKMADFTMLYKWIVKFIAEQSDMVATFMPKPIEGINGSGMHIHQSLANEKGDNLFFDSRNDYGLSDIARQFIAGQLKYAREICGILAQWVNSYKRLIPNFEAPTYVSWSVVNRSALIRVPLSLKNREKAARAEIRCADPACNPYLVFAVLLRAGLKGIEEGLELESPQKDNLYNLGYQERKKRGIIDLPGSLGEAIREVEKSELVRQVLGGVIMDNWIALKAEEWANYRKKVHPYELEVYYHL